MSEEKLVDGELGLSFDFPFTEEMEKRIPEAQKYVDESVINLNKPYTPFVTGKLIQAATIGTTIGSGKIVYDSPYARFQYYGLLMVSPTTGSAWAQKDETKILTNIPLKYSTFQNPLAGAKWFERMKTDHIKEIEKGTLDILEGKKKKNG